MAYSEHLADRIRKLLARRQGITERHMFGGVAFLHHGNMCCGVVGDTLMLRVGRDQYDTCLRYKHVKPMDFTGKPLKGFIYVLPDGIERSKQLKRWVDIALAFSKTLPKKSITTPNRPDVLPAQY